MFHPSLNKWSRALFWPILKGCELLSKVSPDTLLKIRHYVRFKRPLNLKDPKDLNEKICWAKLYSDTRRWTLLADKYKVRDYIKSIGLEDTLPELYAVWYNADDVSFDELPDDFIIKANNGDGKGTNKIIHKNEISPRDFEDIKATVKYWLSRKNIGALVAEPQYQGMTPCVIAERLLPITGGGNTLIDYKFWCFNGKAKYIVVYTDRSLDGSKASVMVYDLNWQPHPELLASKSDYTKGAIIPSPKNLNKMISVAEKISAKFPQLRVDLYNVDGEIYFGEMTFTSQGGLMYNFTHDFLLELGQMVDINDFPIAN